MKITRIRIYKPQRPNPHFNQSDMIVLETTPDTCPDAEADSLTDIYTYSRRTRDSAHDGGDRRHGCPCPDRRYEAG